MASVRFLEKQGWERVSVVGLVGNGDAVSGHRVLAQYHGVIYSLRPSIISHLPDPGVYWADLTGSHWDLLFPDGSEGSFIASSLD